MAKDEKFTTRQIIEAIKDTYGVKSAIAKKLGCHRFTVDRYIRTYVTVRRAYEEERERPIDMAEAKAYEKLQEGYWPAIKYMLSTRGKDRGYVERQEVKQEIGSDPERPIVIKEVIVERPNEEPMDEGE